MSAQKEDRDYIERINLSDVNTLLSKKLGDDYISYRNEWDKVEAEKGAYVPSKPLCLSIGVSNVCNLNCKNCTYRQETRKRVKQELSYSVISRIADEAKEMAIPSIALGMGSEVTMHPDFKKFVLKLNDATTDLWFYTNGINLSEDLSRFLIIEGVQRLLISLDAATPETYRLARGADLNKIESNIESFLMLRDELEADLPILRLSFVKMAENLNEIQLFYDKWKDKADIIDYQDLLNFENIEDPKPLDIDPFFCSHPFSRLAINYNGDILACCGGYCRHHVLGNIDTATLYDAWNGDKMKALRESFLLGNISPACQNCYGNLKNRDNASSISI